MHRVGSARSGECGRFLSKLIGLSAPVTGGGGWGGDVIDTSCFASRTAARQNAALEALQAASDELLTVHDAVHRPRPGRDPRSLCTMGRR